MFWVGFPAKIEDQIHHWLEVVKLDLHPEGPYLVADVVVAVKFLLMGSTFHSTDILGSPSA